MTDGQARGPAPTKKSMVLRENLWIKGFWFLSLASGFGRFKWGHDEFRQHAEIATSCPRLNYGTPLYDRGKDLQIPKNMVSLL